MLKHGQQILYVPTHARDDMSHSDIEYGFVMRDQREGDDSVFCRYWLKGYVGTQIRTLSCSECTPVSCIIVKDYIDQKVITEAINKILNETIKECHHEDIKPRQC
jgi:hypothetical protein